jgi:hypothetical protein
VVEIKGVEVVGRTGLEKEARGEQGDRGRGKREEVGNGNCFVGS